MPDGEGGEETGGEQTLPPTLATGGGGDADGGAGDGKERVSEQDSAGVGAEPDAEDAGAGVAEAPAIDAGAATEGGGDVEVDGANGGSGGGSGSPPGKDDDDDEDGDLELDDEPDDSAPQAAEAAAAEAEGEGKDGDAALQGDKTAEAESEDLDLDDESEEDAAPIARKSKKSRFIEDAASEDDDEGIPTNADGDSDNEEEDGTDNRMYQLDGFVVDEAEATGEAESDDEDGDGSGSLQRKPKRKQPERNESEEEEEVREELRELARDKGIELGTAKSRKRIKGGRIQGDDDMDTALDEVVDKNDTGSDVAEEEEEADRQQSLMDELRSEATGMFAMEDVYDNIGEIGDESVEEQEEGGGDGESKESAAAPSWIEPDVLRKGFMTAGDEEIRAADVPERLQLHMLGQKRNLIGQPPTEEELREEASWIINQHFALVNHQITEQAVTNALRHLLVKKEDHPQICKYRKESIAPLESADVWQILAMDLRWDHFSHRRQKLLAAAAKLGDILGTEYMELLQNAQTLEQLSDLDEFLKQQAPGGTDEQSPAGKKSTSKANSIAKARTAGLDKFIEQSGMTAALFGNNVDLEMRKNEVEDPEQLPEDMAKDFVCDAYPDEPSVIRGARNMLAQQIAAEPAVRKYARTQYHLHLGLLTEPTIRGKEQIDQTHRCNGIRNIRKKLTDLRGQEFLLIESAERQGLVNVSIETLESNWRERIQQECEGYLLSSKENLIAASWNELRRGALTKAFDQILLPALEREVRNDLSIEAREKLCTTFKERFLTMLERGPFTADAPRRSNDNDQDQEGGGGHNSIMACVWDKELRDSTVSCVLLDKDGGHRETLELPFMHLPEMDQRKRDTVKMWLDFVKKRKPMLIAIGTNGRPAETLFQAFTAAIYTQDDLHATQVQFVDAELPRIYQNSERADKEYPDMPATARLALGVGRMAYDPLAEYANILSDEKDFAQVAVHPLQDLMDDRMRLRMAEQCMVDAVNFFGIDINQTVKTGHASAKLRFLSGLGPRKAQSIFGVLENDLHKIQSREEMKSRRLMGKVVYMSCVGFCRIDHSKLVDEDDDEDDRNVELLDNMMIHPDIGYELARKMAVDALDIEIDEDSDEPQLKETFRKAVAHICKKPDALEDLDLDMYATELERANKETGNLLTTLNTIKVELGTRGGTARQYRWMPLAQQDLFRAMAGFHGRDVFAGVTEMQLYNGEPDVQNAQIRLDCGLAGRIRHLSLDPYSNGFEYGVPHLYACSECYLDEERGRIRLEMTRNPQDLKRTIDFECGILCDGLDTAGGHCITIKNADTTIQHRASKIEWRAITHPDFQNVTYNGARRFLEGEEGSSSDFLIRPSSKGRDHLTVTIKFYDSIFLNVDVLEKNRTETSSIGKPLLIEEEEYEDLDDIIYRFIHPLVDYGELAPSHLSA
jgi:transcription elongation factor SPT6